MANGQVDAAVVSQPLSALDEASGKVRPFSPAPASSETLDYLAASDAALANPQKKAAIADFMVRFYKAEAILAKDPALAAQTYVKTYGVSPPVAEQAVASVQAKGIPDHASHHQLPAKRGQYLPEAGSRPDHFNVASSFDLPFNKTVARAAGLHRGRAAPMTQVATPPVGRTPGAAAGRRAAGRGPVPLPVGDGPAARAGLARPAPARSRLDLRRLVDPDGDQRHLPHDAVQPECHLGRLLEPLEPPGPDGRHRRLGPRAIFGLALGAGIGLVLGIVVGLSRLGEELFDASMQMLRMIPYPAVIFLFIVWFGIGETAKVLLIGLATLFPMYLNASNGVRNVDRRVVEAARTLRAPGPATGAPGGRAHWPCPRS